jgi:hypothetical protein
MTTDITPNPFDNIQTSQTMAFENSNLFTKTQLDWLIKTRQKNGLAETGAVLKISGKIYINKPKFFDWFMQQNAG